MNTTPTGFFAGTDNLDASSKLPYLPPTFSGICRVDLCKGISVRKGGRAFIAELTVLTSNLDHLDPSDSKYVAIGSLLRVALGVAYAKYQVGKRPVFPKQGKPLPQPYVEALQRIAVRVVREEMHL